MQKVEATFKEEEKLREAAQKEFHKKELKDKKVIVMLYMSLTLELFL